MAPKAQWGQGRNRKSGMPAPLRLCAEPPDGAPSAPMQTPTASPVARADRSRPPRSEPPRPLLDNRRSSRAAHASQAAHLTPNVDARAATTRRPSPSTRRPPP
ncbi:hypothetical protein ZWY2020_022044 [Hordeum vulgare]|nr:hypothetical protein ZWY2020_022044 [Hordeum vulgare]